ncbi:hypothetical protein R3P38DRAFT_3177929 [Favolaschia claudopus]|uniref:Uncharacterized protein n=1 Tax=Favolaschia claudopus TaxID=2862362 RepID=A0AAW0CUC6_9AGAR
MSLRNLDRWSAERRNKESSRTLVSAETRCEGNRNEVLQLEIGHTRKAMLSREVGEVEQEGWGIWDTLSFALVALWNPSPTPEMALDILLLRERRQRTLTLFLYIPPLDVPPQSHRLIPTLRDHPPSSKSSPPPRADKQPFGPLPFLLVFHFIPFRVPPPANRRSDSHALVRQQLIRLTLGYNYQHLPPDLDIICIHSISTTVRRVSTSTDYYTTASVPVSIHSGADGTERVLVVTHHIPSFLPTRNISRPRQTMEPIDTRSLVDVEVDTHPKDGMRQYAVRCQAENESALPSIVQETIYTYLPRRLGD